MIKLKNFYFSILLFVLIVLSVSCFPEDDNSREMIKEEFYIGVSSSHYVDVNLNQEPVLIAGTGQFLENITSFVNKGENKIEIVVHSHDASVSSATEIVVIRGKNIYDGEIVLEKRDVLLNDNDVVAFTDSFVVENIDIRDRYLAEAEVINELNEEALIAGVNVLVQKVFDAYKNLDFIALNNLMYSSKGYKSKFDNEVRRLQADLAGEEIEMEFAGLENLDLHFGRKTILVRNKEGGLLVRSNHLVEEGLNLPVIELEKIWLIKVDSEWYVLP